METKNPIEGVRLPGAVASLRSRDDSLGTYRRRVSVCLELGPGWVSGRTRGRIDRIDNDRERAQSYENALVFRGSRAPGNR